MAGGGDRCFKWALLRPSGVGQAFRTLCRGALFASSGRVMKNTPFFGGGIFLSHLGVMAFFIFSINCLVLYFLPGTGIHPNLCVTLLRMICM